jgi:hypothetical protein
MILLQAASSLGVFSLLTQYGALGIITIGLGLAFWFLLKRQMQSEDSLKKRVDELQTELTKYIVEDQQYMRETINNNTKALQELRDLIVIGKLSVNGSNIKSKTSK